MPDLTQNKLYIIGGVFLIIVMILIMFLVLGKGFGGKPPQKASLQFWGVFDESKFYRDIINQYRQLNPNISVTYKQFSPQDYEKELLNSFSSNTGPDIWLMHNTWLPKHSDKIQPLPQDIQETTKKPLLTLKEFKEQFVDVAVSDLTIGGNLYSLPLYVDSLALYWNKDIFNSKGIAKPPVTWDEFNKDVARITEFDNLGNLRLSAAAIGTAENINRSTDLLGMLFLQSGTLMTDINHTNATFSKPVDGQAVGESALQYYTDFADPLNELYTWNDGRDYSIDAFVNGSTAMMFNYSHQVAVLKTRSPRLNYGVAPVPQFGRSDKKISYASYWSPTVSKLSANSLEAWKFILFMTSKDQVNSYLVESNRSSARRDLIDRQKIDPILGVFAEQALSAKSWYQVDSTAIETIFAAMIDAVNFKGSSVKESLRSAESKVSVLMSKARR